MPVTATNTLKPAPIPNTIAPHAGGPSCPHPNHMNEKKPSTIAAFASVRVERVR